MNKVEAEKAFANLCEQLGVEMTPENCLRCIEMARKAMLAGECSVEAYYAAKRLLIEKVEVASLYLN